MKALYVERSIEIDATPAEVWRVLTWPELTSQWAGEFGAAGPIESDWKLGGAVLWRNGKGEVYVHGRVTAVDPAKLLRFTVCDAARTRRPISGLEKDEITQSYALASLGARTRLSTAHGDFAALPDGEELLPAVGALWDRLLPKLKALAERARSLTRSTS
jgi:uncharacterized protein YndB with AHSA1/START domain